MSEIYRILVVDVDLSIVNIIETTLKQECYHVLTAHDGETACHIADAKHPHLIIMDVMMLLILLWLWVVFVIRLEKQ